MITLAIDISTPHGSVALLERRGQEPALLFDERFTADRSHSTSLFAALEKARRCVDHIDQIAVGLGPGSYAGVRIAIAAALGLRLALGGKLVGIPSVAALDTKVATDFGATWPTGYVAIGDARRDSFYFTRVESGVCIVGPLLATEAELRQRLKDSDRSDVYATEPVPQFPEAQIALPSALNLALMAATHIGIVATDHLEPIYLREPHITQPKAQPRMPPLQ